MILVSEYKNPFRKKIFIAVEDAKKILYNTNHIYSSKELYHCFYESPDPVKAYKDMMSEKAKLQIEKTEDLLRRNGV